MKLVLPLSVGVCAALVLGGCAQLDQKRPDELVRYGMQRNLLQDNQYNFSGQYRLQVLDGALQASAEDEVKQGAYEAAISDAAVLSHESVSGSSTMHQSTISMANATEDDVDEPSEEDASSPAKLRWQRFFANAVSAPFSGAVDLPGGQIEVIPELRYETRNALSLVRLPMQLDIKKATMVVDPGAIAPYWDLLGLGKGTVLGDRYVKVTLPEHIRRDLPMKELWAALPKAVDDGYASLDPQRYQRLPMDEDGRRAGAHSRVGMLLTDDDSQKMAAAMLKSLSDQLKVAEQQNQSAPVQQKKYKDALEVISQLERLMTLPDVVMRNTDQVEKTKPMQLTEHVDIYQDRRGRIVAIKQRMSMVRLWDLFGFQKNMDLVVWMTLDYSKPKFLLHSTAANTQDLSALVFDNDSATEGDQHADASAAVQPPVVSNASGGSALQALQDLARDHDNISVEEP